MDSVEGITSEDLGPAETSKQKTGADFVRDRLDDRYWSLLSAGSQQRAD
jgi:hypothetical protein